MGEVTVLTIGTTHPWNIAGVGLDLRVAAELRVRALAAVAAVSAQNEHGVRMLHAVPGEVLRAQLDAVPWSSVKAIRVGALGSQNAVYVVAEAARASGLPVVVDPVFEASTGGALAGPSTIDAIRSTLLALPQAIVTPNLDEAATLLDAARIKRPQLEAAAALLLSRGARAVLLKGGHLDGDPVDVLATASETTLLESPRIDGSMRGTGCVLAMSLACALAGDATLHEAVAFARQFVRTKIAGAVQFAGVRTAY